MAIRRPFKSISTGLQEFSDSELEYLSYQTRVAFANYLVSNTTGYGAVYVASSGDVSIGSHTDTKKTQQVSSDGDGGFTGNDSDAGHGPDEGHDPNPAGNAPSSSHDPGDYPAAPGTSTTTVSTYNYRQDQNEPSYPSDANLTDHSYLVSTSAGILQCEIVEQNFLDTLITSCVTEMRNTDGNGDEVGTYRISINAPVSGGAGTWTEIENFYVDSTYSGTASTYKLWVKRSLDTAPGTDVMPMTKGSGSNIQQAVNEAGNPIITDILLPILQRRIANDLTYTVTSSNVAARNRGTIIDTRLNSDTTSYQTGPGDTYRTFSTPSGSGFAYSTKYFLIV